MYAYNIQTTKCCCCSMSVSTRSPKQLRQQKSAASFSFPNPSLLLVRQAKVAAGMQMLVVTPTSVHTLSGECCQDGTRGGLG